MNAEGGRAAVVGATAANAMAISMRTCHSERQRTRERKTGTPTAARFLTFLSQFAQLLHLLDLLLAFLPLKLLQPHLHGRGALQGSRVGGSLGPVGGLRLPRCVYVEGLAAFSASLRSLAYT